MHRFASLRNGSIVTLCSLSTVAISNCDNNVKRRPLYCTSDDIPLNNSDISTSSGFYIQFDSRTRNPKYVVQRSIHSSNVRNVSLFLSLSLFFYPLFYSLFHSLTSCHSLCNIYNHVPFDTTVVFISIIIFELLLRSIIINFTTIFCAYTIVIVIAHRHHMKNLENRDTVTLWNNCARMYIIWCLFFWIIVSVLYCFHNSFFNLYILF